MLTCYTHSDTVDILVLILTGRGACASTLPVDHALRTLLLLNRCCVRGRAIFRSYALVTKLNSTSGTEATCKIKTVL